jgi:drug/metabolite transporter (DMT)-like permease
MKAFSAARAALAASPTLSAVAFMVMASILMATMHAMVRAVSFGMDPFEIAFFRNLFGFLVLVPMLLRAGGRHLRTSRFGLHLLRGGINSISMLMWFTALSMIPLADATALSLTGPLFVTLGAMMFLGEVVRARRWAALIIGSSGALLIIRPGFEALNIGALLAIGGAAFAAGSKLVAKNLTRTDSATAIAAWVQLLMMVITFVPALFVWQGPTGEQWVLLIILGACGGLGHLCLTKAYAIADLSFAEPIVFFRMIWATVIGYLWFAEIPDIWTWAGAFLILSATTYIAHRERRIRKQAGSGS